MSDLHLEVGREPNWWPAVPAALPPGGVDVVVLAGDIHSGVAGIWWASRVFPNLPVVYVLGNHEYYGCNWRGLQEEARAAGAETGVHVLEQDQIELCGYRFLGCTLWTDFACRGDAAEGQFWAKRHMQDYAAISCGEADHVPLHPTNVLRRHVQHRDWLQQQLSRGDPHKTVVVTHHGISPQQTDPQYRGDVLNPAFVSNMERFVELSEAALWISGHTHYDTDLQFGRTRCVSRQCGYTRRQRQQFQSLTVELP